MDGSEDKETHCIKDGGIAADAFVEISRSTAALLISDEAGSDDPFADASEPDDELGENKVIIDDEGDDSEAAEDQETSDNED